MGEGGQGFSSLSIVTSILDNLGRLPVYLWSSTPGLVLEAKGYQCSTVGCAGASYERYAKTGFSRCSVFFLQGLLKVVYGANRKTGPFQQA